MYLKLNEEDFVSYLSSAAAFRKLDSQIFLHLQLHGVKKLQVPRNIFAGKISTLKLNN